MPMGTIVFFFNSNIHTVLTFQIFSPSKFNMEMFLFFSQINMFLDRL